jgi:hypothetical protein
MKSAIERLRAFLPKRRSLAQRIGETTGLPVILEEPLDPDEEHLDERILEAIETLDFQALITLFDDLKSTDDVFSDGRRKYALARDALTAPMAMYSANPEACKDLLGHYEAWWKECGRSPAASGIYAVALAETGFAHRGTDWAHKVRPEDWEHFADYCMRAAEVVAPWANKPPEDYLYAHSMFRFCRTAIGVDPSALPQLPVMFDYAVRQDPYDISIYQERAHSLLPRWTGSYDAIEAFAMTSAERTGDRYRWMMYARIYDTIFNWEQPADTSVTYSKLVQGFRDWIDLYPSQALLNRFAAHAHVMNDFSLVEDLLTGPIREIHPQAWFDEDQMLDAWDCVRPNRRRMPNR